MTSDKISLSPRLAALERARRTLCQSLDGAAGNVASAGTPEESMLFNQLEQEAYAPDPLDTCRDDLRLRRALTSTKRQARPQISDLTRLVAFLERHCERSDPRHRDRCVLRPVKKPARVFLRTFRDWVGEKEETLPGQRLLRDLAGRCRLTPYGLARLANVTPSYVQRLFTGQRRQPSRAILLALGTAMTEYTTAVTAQDVDRLLRLAGYPPAPRKR